jgi:hypothetical protein
LLKAINVERENESEPKNKTFHGGWCLLDDRSLLNVRWRVRTGTFTKRTLLYPRKSRSQIIFHITSPCNCKAWDHRQDSDQKRTHVRDWSGSKKTNEPKIDLNRTFFDFYCTSEYRPHTTPINSTVGQPNLLAPKTSTHLRKNAINVCARGSSYVNHMTWRLSLGNYSFSQASSQYEDFRESRVIFKKFCTFSSVSSSTHVRCVHESR